MRGGQGLTCCSNCCEKQLKGCNDASDADDVAEYLVEEDDGPEGRNGDNISLLESLLKTRGQAQ